MLTSEIREPHGSCQVAQSIFRRKAIGPHGGRLKKVHDLPN